MQLFFSLFVFLVAPAVLGFFQPDACTYFRLFHVGLISILCWSVSIFWLYHVLATRLLVSSFVLRICGQVKPAA
jgi:cell division protein FtsW (lipid II flippase)